MNKIFIDYLDKKILEYEAMQRKFQRSGMNDMVTDTLLDELREVEETYLSLERKEVKNSGKTKKTK